MRAHDDSLVEKIEYSVWKMFVLFVVDDDWIGLADVWQFVEDVLVSEIDLEYVFHH